MPCAPSPPSAAAIDGVTSYRFDDAIFPELFEAKYGLKKQDMVKMNIKGVFQVWMRNGDYHEINLKETHAWTREGCNHCPDFAAEHADISTGGIGDKTDWTLTAVRTDLGRAIRAVAKEKQGARLMGIDVDHVYAMSFGIGLACLGAGACLLLPAYYVNPQVGSGFVLVAFTIVVLGGMGSFAGAFLGGLLIGVVESLGGLLLGESLGQVGIFLIFILVLLLRPQGLFGARA